MSDDKRTILKFETMTHEFFDDTFMATGMSGDEARDKCEELLIVLRAKAAATAMAKLVHHGWFHGQILSGVHSYETGDVNVQVILVDYGELNPPAMATCHPERPEYCGGYCESCFGG